MPEPRDSSVYKLLNKIICALVDHDDAVVITAAWTDTGASFVVDTHPEDKGKLIGVQGRNAKSIRTIMQAIGMKHGRTYTVIVQE